MRTVIAIIKAANIRQVNDANADVDTKTSAMPRPIAADEK